MLADPVACWSHFWNGLHPRSPKTRFTRHLCYSSLVVLTTCTTAALRTPDVPDSSASCGHHAAKVLLFCAVLGIFNMWSAWWGLYAAATGPIASTYLLREEWQFTVVFFMFQLAMVIYAMTCISTFDVAINTSFMFLYGQSSACMLLGRL